MTEKRFCIELITWNHLNNVENKSIESKNVESEIIESKDLEGKKTWKSKDANK